MFNPYILIDSRVSTLLEQLTSILITGGTGFIGSHLVKELLLSGCCVTVIDHNIEARARLGLPEGGRLQILNIALGQALTTSPEIFKTADIIFHLAGNSSVQKSIAEPFADFEAALGDTVRLLEVLRSPSQEAMTRQPLLIFPSSAAVYGNPESVPIKETDPTNPISPYGVSKLASEKYIEVYCRLYRLRAVVLRAFSVYGPGQKKQVVYDILQKLVNDPDKLEILGDGSQRRDFIHIADFVGLMIHCATMCPEDGNFEIFNAATGTSSSIDELADSIIEVLGVSPALLHTGVSRPGDPERWDVDVSRLAKTGYKPKLGLSEGLKTVIDWHRKVSSKCES